MAFPLGMQAPNFGRLSKNIHKTDRTMSNLRKIILVCFLVCFFTHAFGFNPQENNATDSIIVAQLYNISNHKQPCELTFQTDEEMVQTHDGTEVYCEKRKAVYTINLTDSKVVIKRKVLQSEKSVLANDKTIRSVYPDVTSALLCGLLKPDKKKLKDLEANKLAFSATQSGEDCEVTLYKASRLPKQEKTCFGEIVRFDNATEKLTYQSSDRKFFLDCVKKIVSEINLTEITKNGTQHKIDIVENITIL